MFSPNTYKNLARKYAHDAAMFPADREALIQQARDALRMAVEAGFGCADQEAQVQAWVVEAS